jgi:hypothetical protein
MTTSGITCDTFGQRLMDFLEGDLDAETRAAQELHARECRECADLLQGVTRIAAQAAALPRLEPPRDLWSEISARVDSPVLPMHARRRAWPRRVAVGGIAAALIGAAALGRSALVRRQSPPAEQPTALGTGNPRSDAPQVRVAASSPSAVEASYDAEIAQLRAIVASRRSQLDPRTLGVIDRNLKVIDEAIASCKAALERDPASRFLIQTLDQSLGTKVQFLRVAASLPPRS